MRLFQRTYFIVFMIILSSCGGNEVVKTARGGKIYGGVFRFMSNEKITNFFPVSSFDNYTARIISQIYDPILRLNSETMKVEPSIATSYTLSKNAKKITLKIRKNIRFHDDPCFKKGKGRYLNANDLKYSLEVACSKTILNNVGFLLINKIVGAQKFYDNSSGTLSELITRNSSEIEGIKVLDPCTIEINLTEPNHEFDKILTLPSLSIFPREALETYRENIISHPVGTGPFSLAHITDHEIKLVRNNFYWKKDKFGNQLPFLDAIQILYAKNKKSELIAFRQKKIDLVLNIPVEEIENILGSLKDAQAGKNVRHRVRSLKELGVSYIGFAFESKEFHDINVRKAFNYAVNRDTIVEDDLMGDGWPITNGIVPISEINSAHKKVTATQFNPQKAKELFAKAGYPNGKNFPTLNLYVNALKGSKGHKMSVGVAKQLKKHLNVNLNVVCCTFSEREKAIKSGKAKIWKSGWLADYPSAENFLRLFYKGNRKEISVMVNDFKFSSKAYDSTYELALKEQDEKKRAELFARCDQMVVNEAAVMPLLNDDITIMVNTRIKDIYFNPLENFDFSIVYIKEPRSK
jgi:oligopeptide transport system substrate-binding protein